MMRLISLAASVLLATAPAWAEPYWYAYEGNDFPENEGWERHTTDPPVQRWLEDGSFFIDSRGIVGSNDNYTIYFDEGLDPEPDEMFIMSWRLNVHEAVPNREDPGVYVISDDLWTVTFLFDEDSLQSFYEPTVDVELEPHVYHEYEMRSSDMRSYELYIDGELAIEGVFFEGFFSPCVGFGDITSSGSLAAWDYFRFGVVPEPSAVWLVIAGLTACVVRTVRADMRRVILLPVLACVLSASATAEPYWITYEGNDFPENEGWERIVNGPQPAERTLADGIMTMDGLADTQIDDYYRMDRVLDPEPEEQFVMQWRIRVGEIIGHPLALYDPGVAVWSDDDWEVSLLFGTDFVYSFHENIPISVDPDVYHSWEFRSSDMRTYDLMVDGALIHTGVFWEPTFERSKVTWGDKARGAASLADWDHFRFGVVPEPAAIWLVLVGLGAAAALRPRRAPGRLVFLSLLLCALSAPATATPYWVAWEGNDFPENEGWERIVNGPQPAERTLADGIMTINGLADTQIDDYYRMDRLLDPEPEEQFVMQWRLRVQEVVGNPLTLYDPGVAVFSDDDWTVSLLFGTDFIRSFHEHVIIPMQPDVFHEFEFRSSDMRSYELYVDETLVHNGSFWEPTFESSKVAWGDMARGSASLSDWDYFRFGVVPEPWTCTSLLALLCAAHTTRRIQ